MTKTGINKLTAWLLTLAMLMTFIPSFTLVASAVEIVASQPANGDGSASDPYQIGTAAELYWFAQTVNSGNTTICAELMNNITVNTDVVNPDGSLGANVANFTVWTPIGHQTGTSSNTYAFKGTFDGKGHTISGLYFDSRIHSDQTKLNSQAYKGLFGYVGGATIKNVTVADSYFYGTQQIGGIVGQAGYSKVSPIPQIINCHVVNSSINGTTNVGGIVGCAAYSAVIESCTNTGYVTGADDGDNTPSNVGGIVGWLVIGTVTDCHNFGAVSSAKESVGGVVGCTQATVTIQKSSNIGTVSGTNYVSGVVGYVNAGPASITDCYNAGTVTATNEPGYARGIVYGSSSVGNCHNYGSVTGTNVAAIVSGNSSNCYYLDSLGLSDTNATAKTAIDFANGTVVDLLNANHSDAVWVQGENYPMFKPKHQHDYAYTASNNVITESCDCGHSETVTLVAPENLVYDGSEKVVTTSGTIDGVTIPDVQYEGNRVNAGTFTAKLTIDNVTATLNVTITPKSLDGAVIILDNNANLGYTGNAITPDVTSVTLDGITLTTDDYTVSYSDNTNAGQATVTVTGKGNYKETASTNFTITKATPVVTAPTAKTGLTYTGQAQALVDAGSTTGGTKQYSLDDSNYSADIPTVTNAGTYTVYYKVAGDDNYNDVAASSVEVTIGKQTVNKPTIESKEYTGTELTADVPASELYDVAENIGGTDVGEYNVVLELKDSENYKWSSTNEKTVTLKFNITTATNTWETEPSIGGWTFGQIASTPSYEAKFGNNDVVVEYKKEGDLAYTATVPINAGNYTARFSVAATDNYGALEKTVDFTIVKAQAVITVDDAPIEKTYGEAWTLPEATTDFGTVSADKTVADMVNAGEYTVTYTVADDDNFNGATKQVSVTINPKDITNAVVGDFASLTYTGEAQTPSADVTVDGLTVTGAWSDVTNVSDKSTFTASGNFTGTIADVDVGMQKAVLTFAPESVWTARIPAGKALSQANTSFAELLGVDGNPIAGSYEWEAPDKVISDKGDYTEKVIFTPEDANYAPIELDVAVSCYIPQMGGLPAGGDKGTSGKDNLGTPSDDKTDEKADDITLPSDDADKTENTFTDVAPSAWYSDAVEWMNEKGYMSGTGSGKFSPNLPTTRGMVVTVLWRIAGQPAPQGECTFHDVKAGSYYEDAITWAQENGVVTGHSDTVFAPDELITREQLATIIHRNEKRLGNDVSHFNDLEHFVDDHHVSDWALEAKQWAVGAGIISGTSATTLHPKKEATRAETAAILYRMNNK